MLKIEEKNHKIHELISIRIKSQSTSANKNNERRKKRTIIERKVEKK